MSGSPPAEQVISLVCSEAVARTTLTCDEITSFQRIVSACVAAMHGVWKYSQEEQAVTLYCHSCAAELDAHHKKINVDRPRQHQQQQRLISSYGCLTPCCDPVVEASGCTHAKVSADGLSRRRKFAEDDEALIQRIGASSRIIRDSVT